MSLVGEQESFALPFGSDEETLVATLQEVIHLRIAKYDMTQVRNINLAGVRGPGLTSNCLCAKHRWSLHIHIAVHWCIGSNATGIQQLDEKSCRVFE